MTDLARSFAAHFDGTAIAPDDERYETARAVWNGTVDARPVLIAQCRTVEDIVAAVNLTRDAGLPFAVRAGGHSVAGLSTYDGGVVIDLSLMRAVTVDGVSSRYSGFSLEGWKFTGAFVIGPQTLVGEVHGGSASVGTGQFGDAGKIYPFAIGGTSGGSTLSGTCEGMIVSGLPLNSLPVSVDQPLVLQLSCHASINSTPGDFQLVVVLPVATGDFVPDASFQVTHYAGTFGGVGV